MTKMDKTSILLETIVKWKERDYINNYNTKLIAFMGSATKKGKDIRN